jgi:hypothetical protein
MPDVLHKRGSRADLNTLAAANGLLLGQIYVISDEDRLAVATGVASYQAFRKESSFDTDGVGTLSGTTLDLTSGNVFSHAPSSAATYVFSNPPTTGTAYGFTLKVTPYGTYTVTWPASVDWAGGTAPDAPASGATNVYTFYTQDGGTTYYGFLAGAAMA